MLERLHEIIVGLYPDAVIDMAYKMPTYKNVVGGGSGDKGGDEPAGWVAIANQKRYVSLYTCGAHHLVKFKQKHPDIKTGTGCINFRPTDKIPTAAVKQVVRHAMTEKG